MARGCLRYRCVLLRDPADHSAQRCQRQVFWRGGEIASLPLLIHADGFRVKAVFSLARRLSPCVVFLDEVEALFGARSAKGGSFGSKAHDQLLTEFMQEMDGLSSASANKDTRVVVIGATNRPFDLDDAVLRRLPRRLLVDLPGPGDRKSEFRGSVSLTKQQFSRFSSDRRNSPPMWI